MVSSGGHCSATLENQKGAGYGGKVHLGLEAPGGGGRQTDAWEPLIGLGPRPSLCAVVQWRGVLSVSSGILIKVPPPHFFIANI